MTQKRNKRVEKNAYKRNLKRRIKADPWVMIMVHGCYFKTEENKVIKWDPISAYGGKYVKSIKRYSNIRVRRMKHEDIPLGKSNYYKSAYNLALYID